jgi:hypothetical protein
MSEVIERTPVETPQEHVPSHGLFVVWFDLLFGEAPHDWWWEEPGPQPLASALDQAARMRLEGWPSIVCPEGVNPRPDGRWDNP